MFEADLSAVLLTEYGAHHGALLSADIVTSDVVGYGEEDERVQEDVQAVCGFVARQERVTCGGEGCHRVGSVAYSRREKPN